MVPLPSMFLTCSYLFPGAFAPSETLYGSLEIPGALSLEHSFSVLKISSLVTKTHNLVSCLRCWCGSGLVGGGEFGNHELASSSAFPSASETQMGNFMSGDLGSLRVGTTVFRTPWYHDVSLQRSEHGFMEVTKALVCECFVTMIW